MNHQRSQIYLALLPPLIYLGMHRHTVAHCPLKPLQALLVPPLPLRLDLISLQSQSLVIRGVEALNRLLSTRSGLITR